MPRCEDVVRQLRDLANPADRAGMARFGITTDRALGVHVPVLRRLAKSLGRDHDLAGELWATGIHEARLLAGFVDNPAQVTKRQMDAWVRDFDSWDLCDLVCSDLFDRTPHAWTKAFAWSARRPEYVKRAGFVLMAALSVHDRAAVDADFGRCFPTIVREATDARNFVRKAVNWALRSIGKRNLVLNRRAVAVARRIEQIDSKAARWIARDALRELTGPKVQARLRRRRRAKE